jgi:hypothetical protein
MTSSRVIALIDASVTSCPYGCAPPYKTRGKTRAAIDDGSAFACVSATSCCARTRSSASAGNVEFTSMSARMSRVDVNLPLVATKLIDPLSLPIAVETFVPSNCSAFDSDSPSRVFVPSFSIDAVSAATPRRSGFSNWSAPPRIVIENDTSGRSCFSDRISSAPLVRVDRVQTGTRSTGGFPGGGIFVRSSACRAISGAAAMATATTATATRRFARRRSDVIAWPPLLRRVPPRLAVPSCQ